jgi:hypothetical protein
MENLKKSLKFTKYLARYSGNLLQYPFMDSEAIFKDIYEKNIWDNSETVSGDSSTHGQTETLRQALPGLIEEYNIKSMLDIPCGDFNWMKDADFELDSYIGADIVDSLVKLNSQRYPEAGTFMQLNICNDQLPKVNLIFCRDCLVHLSFKEILTAIDNIKQSGAEYLLTTTFPDRKSNKNTFTGAWRTLNFEKSPFCFPPPLKIINEKFQLRGGRFQDKSMGLWKIRDLP